MIKTSIILLLFLCFTLTFSQQHNVGDTLSFWSPSYIDMEEYDELPQQYKIFTECRYVGTRCYFFVDTTLSNIVTDDELAAEANKLDSIYIPRLTDLYGDLPNTLDNDDRLYIVIMEEPDWHGFFDPANEMTEDFVYSTYGQHSNEKELIYVTEQAFLQNTFSTTVSHEMGHMIHYNADHSPTPGPNFMTYWEETWLNEASATFAAIYCLEDVNEEDVFLQYPYFRWGTDESLIFFEGGISYQVVELWMLYIYERFGAEFVKALLWNQTNGLDSVNETLVDFGYTTNFNSVFMDWVTAAFLDESGFLPERFSYRHYNFEYNASPVKIFFRYPMTETEYNIESYGSDGYDFIGRKPTSFRLNFNGSDSSKFMIRMLKYDFDDEVISMEDITLDNNNDFSYQVENLDLDYKKLTMIVGNIDSSLAGVGKATYTIMCDEVVEIEDDNILAGDYQLMQNYPNPFNPSTTIKYNLAESGKVLLEVFNTLGERVDVLVDKDVDKGTHQVVFNADNLPGGVYFYRLQANNKTFTNKMILLK